VPNLPSTPEPPPRPVIASKSKPVEKEEEQEEEQEEEESDEEKDPSVLKLEALLKTAHENDIYLLFGIDATTSVDEIGKKRRQLTQQLHPDNFVKGSEEWHEAQQKMARVNQAYNNVLRKDASRALYDKVTAYRQSYAKLLRKVKIGMKWEEREKETRGGRKREAERGRGERKEKKERESKTKN
jgi:DnaJ domain